MLITQIPKKEVLKPEIIAVEWEFWISNRECSLLMWPSSFENPIKRNSNLHSRFYIIRELKIFMLLNYSYLLLLK